MRVSEIRVKRIRVNQGLGVYSLEFQENNAKKIENENLQCNSNCKHLCDQDIDYRHFWHPLSRSKKV